MIAEKKRKRGRPLGRMYPDTAPIQARVTQDTMVRLRKKARHEKNRLSDQLRSAIKMYLGD